MSQVFCSNILYKQPLLTDKDVTISFLIQDPAKNTDNGNLLLQTNDKLLQQNNTDFIVLQYNNTYQGFGIFLVNSNVPLLTGGGSGSGLGVITDSTTSSLSAVSGYFLGAFYDIDGIFSLSGGLTQLNTGTNTPITSSFVVRKLSSFEYVDSTQISSFSKPFNDEWNVFRVAFKNKMQNVVLYSYIDEVYTKIVDFKTNIDITDIPESVRVGISWSGNFPIKIKNININGSFSV